MKRTTLLAAVTLSLFAGAAIAQDKAPEKTTTPAQANAATLKVGDTAPPLSVTNWVKGDAVTGFEKGRPYVVEFWATWCGPCIASMPHLTELQAEYKSKGLVIIGMSSMDKRGNTLEAVNKMVKEKGDGMGYTVAYDADRATSDAYMKASGQSGIPCSFVVDKTGKIAYIGHPIFLDPVLDKVVAGTWDYTKDTKAIDEIQDEYWSVLGAEPSAEVLKKIQTIETRFPSLSSGLVMPKYMAQLATDDAKGAAITGKIAVDRAIKSKSAEELNGIAWTIVDPEGNVKTKDLDLAFKAATEANKITGDKDGAILDTLARVYWLKGDKAKAIETQTKAVANAKGPMKEDLEKTLNEYKGTK